MTTEGLTPAAIWQKFADAAPELASFGRALIDKFGGAFLATLRKDGSPRLHPVVPIIADGRLFVFIGSTSPKLGDLKRDGRYALHVLIDHEDNEFAVTGIARFADDEVKLWEAAAAAAPYKVPRDGTHILFELDIESAMSTTWYHPGQPDTRPTHRHWNQKKGLW